MAEGGMTRKRRWRGLVGAGGLLLIAACSQEMRAYRREYSAWRRATPVSYEFEYRRICFCPGAGVWWRVQVERGVVAHAAIVDTAYIGKGANTAMPGDPPPVDSLFAFAKRALDGDNARVEIAYDSLLHYPTLIRVDPKLEVADDELEYEVRRLKAVGKLP